MLKTRFAFFYSSVVALLLGVALMLPAASVASAATIGCASLGQGTPMAQYIYFINSRSALNYWDLTNDSRIPAGATITTATMSWLANPSYGFSGMHEGLFDATGHGQWFLYSGVTNSTDFAGKPAKQKWESQFYVTMWNSPGYPLQINPSLSICYSF